MWFYRRILRVKWTDKRTNESVLRELKTERTLLNLINARKLKYVGHALRNHRTSLMKTVCEGRLDGRRRKGRPPTFFVTNLTTACGLSLHQIVQKSQDRAGWQQKGSPEITPIFLDVCLPRSCRSEDLNKALKQNDTQPVSARCTEDLDIGEDPWAIVSIIVLGIFLSLMVAGTLAEFCVGSRPLRSANLINAFVPSSSPSDPVGNGISSITLNGGMGKPRGHWNEGFELSESPRGDSSDDLGKNYPYRKALDDGNWLNGTLSSQSATDRLATPRQSGESHEKPSNDTAHLSKWHRVLLSFSLPRNTGKILGVKAGPGSIGCLHGIRVLSMAWVILGHVIIFGATSNNFKNRLSIYELEETFLFQAIINAPLSVDSFFFMRLTPPMMIWIMIVACLVKYVGEGRPGWVDYPGAQVCRDNWWLNMLYIQNLWIERMGVGIYSCQNAHW
ncbi:nose resistant to fluoxetine protein 6 [Elysia marginata]|uniref:Nose resistant to fluoxetine protein 6 n=1 Tax=Elysia marginata TaxID=1093978 RepID=A0AAV4EHL7_9GAST|nr:nose resistant to fluoxetine protein 6 [Elysia marginata]